MQLIILVRDATQLCVTVFLKYTFCGDISTVRIFYEEKANKHLVAVQKN